MAEPRSVLLYLLLQARGAQVLLALPANNRSRFEFKIRCRGRDSNPYALVGPRILSPPRLSSFATPAVRPKYTGGHQSSCFPSVSCARCVGVPVTIARQRGFAVLQQPADALRRARSGCMGWCWALGLGSAPTSLATARAVCSGADPTARAGRRSRRRSAALGVRDAGPEHRGGKRVRDQPLRPPCSGLRR